MAWGDQPLMKAFGAGAAIFIAPRLFAEVMTKPRLVRMFMEGMKAGPKSTALMQAMRKMSTMWAASQKDPKKTQESMEAYLYYNTIPKETAQ